MDVCKKIKNLQILRFTTIVCKALKPLETTLLDTILIDEVFIVFVFVLRQCSHICLREFYFVFLPLFKEVSPIPTFNLFFSYYSRLDLLECFYSRFGIFWFQEGIERREIKEMDECEKLKLTDLEMKVKNRIFILLMRTNQIN